MFRSPKRTMLAIGVVIAVVGSVVGYSVLHVRRGEPDENEVKSVKFRGVVVSWPNLGVLGVSGVNVQIDEVLFDPTHHLKIGDVATVTMPVVPPFVPRPDIGAGDRVEVFGGYSTIEEMPDFWSKTEVGNHWIWLTRDFTTVLGENF